MRSNFELYKKWGFHLELMTPYEYYEKYPYNVLVFHLLYPCVYIKIPQILKPRKKIVSYIDSQNRKNPIKKQYTEFIQRAYGILFFEDTIHVHYGIQPGCWSIDDKKNSDHVKVFYWPWNYRHVRHDYYDIFQTEKISEAEFRRLPHSYDIRGPEESWFISEFPGCYLHFNFLDSYDNTEIRAKVNVEEREWRRGLGFFKFLGLFPPFRKVRRYLNIEFEKETGPRKGSWKGGTMGCSIEMKPGETVTEAWDRFCIEEKKRVAKTLGK